MSPLSWCWSRDLRLLLCAAVFHICKYTGTIRCHLPLRPCPAGQCHVRDGHRISAGRPVQT